MSHPRILLGLILCSCIALATGRLAALPAPDCWQEPENETFTIAEIELISIGSPSPVPVPWASITFPTVVEASLSAALISSCCERPFSAVNVAL